MSENQEPPPPKDHETKFTSSSIVSSENGWITPAGTFYACTPEEHDELANFLWQSKRANIEHRIVNDKTVSWEIQRRLDKLPARTIVKAAGYALLSGGLLAEENIPKNLTAKQLEIIGKSQAKFTPESGRLDPTFYLEYRGLLQQQTEQFQQITQDLEAEHIRNIENFISNPTQALVLSDFYSPIYEDDITQILDLLSPASIGEVSISGPRASRTNYRYRHISLPSSGEVYLQLKEHEHAFGDTGDRDYVFSIVSLEQIEKFQKPGPHTLESLKELNTKLN
ncbi:hypothetical protein ACFL2V_13715 [Pseudomonadota bacterium]